VETQEAFFLPRKCKHAIPDEKKAKHATCEANKKIKSFQRNTEYAAATVVMAFWTWYDDLRAYPVNAA
jgi:hypothetical protein